MYEKASVISSTWVSNDIVTLTDPTQISKTPMITNQYSTSSPLDNQVIVFVPGWRMKISEMTSYADTMFKRLYWQGYTGRFVVFEWPTNWVDTNSNWAVLSDPTNYDQSEENAWYSGAALANLLLGLDAQYGYQHVNLIAHSMGNVVAGEALRLATTEQFAPIPNVQPVVNAYIASQAAIPAEAYDANAPQDLRTQAQLTIRSLPQWKQTFTNLAEKPPTPDIYLDYPGRVGYQPGVDVPLFSTSSSAVVKAWNFYNPKDAALTMWEINEVLKPDNGYKFSLTVDANGNFPPPVAVDGNGDFVQLGYRLNMYQILAFAAQPRSLSLGMEATGGAFAGNNEDMNNPATFNFGTDHSAQFDGTEEQRSFYWQNVVQDMGVTHW